MFSALVAATSVGLVALLVWLGSASVGPLGGILELAGAGVGRIEARLVHRVRGPGRAATMPWLSEMRSHPARLRQPDRLLIGAYDSALPGTLDGVLRLENKLGTALPLIHVYTAWGDRADQRFPLRLLQAVHDLGSIPVVTWEPWLVDFENRLHPHLPLRDGRDRGGLAAIAAGVYDFYIDSWARDAARYRRPLMLRFAHEMNDPYRYPWGPHNNDVADFIAAWRRVVARFRSAGADNVVWVWSPHVAYAGWEEFYPGHDVVDWTATGVLNYGTVAYWSQWWTFKDIFGRHYESMAAFDKPIMIAEFGSLAVGGDRAAWLAAALDDLPRRYPAVQALLFFHADADNTVTYQQLDWSVVEDSASTAAVRDALRRW
jgi:hypothetical protein